MHASSSTIAPAGAATVTLLFSDIEGSTRLLQALGPRYSDVIEAHHDIVHESVRKWHGRVIDNAGDGFFIVFARARDAAAAAVEVQRRLAAAEWPEDATVLVRMGLHTGEPSIGGAGYIGLDVHRAARICSAAAGGQVLLSSSTRALIENDLPADVRLVDLGRHRLKDLHDPERIIQLDITDLNREFPPIGGMRSRLHNAGDPATQLIGRDREVGEICDLILRDDVRAVTLTGPGGTGKTRLALAVAIRAAEKFDNGAWFVPLASIREPSLVAPTIARALGVMEHGSRSPFESLVNALGSRHTLLVLDNFEQVTEAAPVVAELLAACPGVEVIITSRGVLHIRSEHAYPVSPLKVPARAGWHDPAALEASPAVRLFIERARAVRPDFALNRENAAVVAEICARLDGLPLAIELASARTRIFSPEALLSRIGRRLDLLKGGARDLPERHQTLRQTIAWSHDLLTAEEQKLFRRLAVFVGGCTVEAAEDLIEASGALEIDVIDGIESLVDRALIRREDGASGDARFVMLETIREFGLERLEAAGETEITHVAHAAHFVDFTERAAPGIAGPEMSIWLDRIEADQDNMRQVMARAERTGDPECALRLGAALWRYWVIRGDMREARERLERILAIPGAREPSTLLGRTLHGLGTMTHEMSDLHPARTYLEEARDVFAALGDPEGTANATAGIGWIAMISGRFDEAESLSQQALERYRQIGDERGIGVALHQIGWVTAARGLPGDAVPITEEVLRIRQRLGDRRAIAFTQTNLASALTLTGDYDRAGTLLDEAFVTLTMLRDRQVSTWNLSRQGILAWHLGDVQVSADIHDETLNGWREVGNDFGLGMSLTEFAPVLARLGHHERAVACLDEADRIFTRAGSKSGLISASIARATCALERAEVDSAVRSFAHCAERAAAVQDGVASATSLDHLALIAARWNRPADAATFLLAADACRVRCGLAIPRRRAEEDALVRHGAGDELRTRSDADPAVMSLRAIELARAWSLDPPGPA